MPLPVVGGYSSNTLGNAYGTTNTVQDKALTDYLQQISNMSLATSPFLPEIRPNKIKYPKAEVSGKGLDELYTKNN